MDIFYYISLALVGIITFAVSFIPEKKFKKSYKKLSFWLVVIFLFFQGWYGYQEKKKTDYNDSRNQFTQDQIFTRQNEISENIKDLKEKDKKGLLTDAEYGRYIAYYLENIDLSIKRFGWKNMREWVTVYYDEVGKIPAYFTLEEWRSGEKFIYDSFVDEINGNFSSRNMYDSGIRLKVLESFKKERERLLSAKEREFNKAK